MRHKPQTLDHMKAQGVFHPDGISPKIFEAF